VLQNYQRRGYSADQIKATDWYKALTGDMKQFVDTRIPNYASTRGALHQQLTDAQAYTGEGLGAYNQEAFDKTLGTGLRTYSHRLPSTGITRPYKSRMGGDVLRQEFINRQLPVFKAEFANQQAFEAEGRAKLGKQKEKFQGQMMDIDNNPKTADDFVVLDPNGQIYSIDGYMMKKLGPKFERKREYYNTVPTREQRQDVRYTDFETRWKEAHPKQLTNAQAWEKFVITPFFVNNQIRALPRNPETGEYPVNTVQLAGRTLHINDPKGLMKLRVRFSHWTRKSWLIRAMLLALTHNDTILRYDTYLDPRGYVYMNQKKLMNLWKRAIGENNENAQRLMAVFYNVYQEELAKSFVFLFVNGGKIERALTAKKEVNPFRSIVAGATGRKVGILPRYKYEPRAVPTGGNDAEGDLNYRMEGDEDTEDADTEPMA
jgi:hypothetical protein